MSDLLKVIASDRYKDGDVIATASVSWLMKNIVSSCDFGAMVTTDQWHNMIVCKALDTGFGHLLESILEKGMLPNAPIGISLITEDHWRYQNGHCGLGLYLNQGHHRLVAAILLGLDTINISVAGKGQYDDDRLPKISAHWNDDEYPVELI